LQAKAKVEREERLEEAKLEGRLELKDIRRSKQGKPSWGSLNPLSEDSLEEEGSNESASSSMMKLEAFSKDFSKGSSRTQ